MADFTLKRIRMAHLHSQKDLYPYIMHPQENLNDWLSCMQACPLLLGLAAQHNKITAFPVVLACLLLRMLNLNGNRYSQHLFCNAVRSFFGAHPLQTGSRNLSTDIACTTTCFQMPCINPWYSSLAADWQAGICAVTLCALAYHHQHAV